MTGAMASSSNGGTPNVSDVRRARAARFSFSPVQDFGSPSFSLGLEKCPPPPTFDGFCGEKGLQKGEEEQNSERKRLPDRAAAPSFSLGLEDIQAPLTSEDCREKETPDRKGRWLSQRQEQQSREEQQFSFSAILDDTPSLSKISECSSTDPLKPAEERSISQGRSSKVFSGPSFSLGLERGCSPGKCNDAHSGEEKQAEDLARSFSDRSNHSSSGAKHPSVFKSSLFQLSSEEHGGDPVSTLLQDSPNGNSKWDVSRNRSGEVVSKLGKLQGRTSALSPPLFEQKTERSPKSNSSVKCSQEQPAKQLRRSPRLSSRSELTGRLKTEPCSNPTVTRRAIDKEAQRKRLGRESTSPEPKKIRPTLISESLLRSHEDQMVQHRIIKDGCTSLSGSGEHSSEAKSRGTITNGFSSNEIEQNPENSLKRSTVPIADDSSKAAAKVTSDRQVGPISRKEEVQEYAGKIGERLPFLPHTQFSEIIDLSPEKGNQHTEMGKIHIVDVSTPPSGGLASNRPVTNSHRRSGSEVVLDSEDELLVDRIAKRRRLSKPRLQVKLEAPSTTCLVDLTCPPTGGARAAGERTPGTPIVEKKKVFKRLRRGSSDNDSLVNKAPQDRIDQDAALNKGKLEPSDPSFGPDGQVHLSVDEFGEQITGASQDEFDDIEDSSEHELLIAGSRPHRLRRSLQAQIIPKKLSLSTPSPAGVKKPVLHIPGLDASVVPERPGKAKGESVTCLDKKFSSNLAKETGNIKAEPITLSDDEELWPETSRSRVPGSRTFPVEVGNGFTSSARKPNLVPDHERAVSGSDVRDCGSRWKGKSPIIYGSDLWKSYTEDFSADDDAGLAGRATGASSSVYKRCQSEDVRISDLLRERLPHFKPVEALLLDGGLDQEPVYIDYRNQFGSSQGMDSAAFAELDCSQPQTRRKQRRASSRGTKRRRASASSSANVSSAGKSPSKGRRKAWTLFRETKGRASTSRSTSDTGYWIQENGRRVYVKDGRTLTGRRAYGAYQKDSGKRSRKTKK